MRDYATEPPRSFPPAHSLQLTAYSSYYLHQELYSVAGLVRANGSLVEAYTYDTYGQARIWEFAPGDLNLDGVSADAEDHAFIMDCVIGGGPASYTFADLNMDGTIDNADRLALIATGGQPIVELASSSVGNPYLFTGRPTHTLASFTHAGRTEFKRIQDNRNRVYDPKHGRWLQRDPLGYVDSMNLYEIVRSRPLVLLDPKGMRIIWKEIVEDSHIWWLTKTEGERLEAPTGGYADIRIVTNFYHASYGTCCIYFRWTPWDMFDLEIEIHTVRAGDQGVIGTRPPFVGHTMYITEEARDRITAHEIGHAKSAIKTYMQTYHKLNVWYRLFQREMFCCHPFARGELIQKFWASGGYGHWQAEYDRIWAGDTDRFHRWEKSQGDSIVNIGRNMVDGVMYDHFIEASNWIDYDTYEPETPLPPPAPDIGGCFIAPMIPYLNDPWP